MRNSQSTLIIWCVGINGLGSARVSYDLIIKSELVFSSVQVFITADSSLYSIIKSSSHIFNSGKVRILVLPSSVRIYPVQFLIKLLTPIGLFANKVLVLDDFPFLFTKNQFVYFHQPNLLFNESGIWRLKRIVFRLLSAFSPIFIIQTKHTKDSFLSVMNCKPSRILQVFHVPSY